MIDEGEERVNEGLCGEGREGMNEGKERGRGGRKNEGVIRREEEEEGTVYEWKREKKDIYQMWREEKKVVVVE